MFYIHYAYIKICSFPCRTEQSRAEPGISIASVERISSTIIIISLEVVYVNHIDGGVRGGRMFGVRWGAIRSNAGENEIATVGW